MNIELNIANCQIIVAKIVFKSFDCVQFTLDSKYLKFPYIMSYKFAHFAKIFCTLFMVNSIIVIVKVIGNTAIIIPLKKAFLEMLLACANKNVLLNELSPATNKNIIVEKSSPEELALPSDVAIVTEKNNSTKRYMK